MKQRFCRYCGKDIENCFCGQKERSRGGDYCPVCGENLPKYETTTKGGRKILSSSAWVNCPTCNPFAEDHPKFKQRVREIFHHNKQSLKILFECPCDSTNKIFHHPDYSLPLSVMKLCVPCHGKEHKKINRQARQQPAEATA